MGKHVQEMRNGNSEGGGRSQLKFFDELREWPLSRFIKQKLDILDA